MRSPRAISFDLDGMLLDGSGQGEAVAKTCAAVAAIHPEITVSRLLGANRDTWASYWPEVEEHWTLGTMSGAAVTEEMWRRALASCGCADEDTVRVACEAFARFERDAFQPFSEAQRVISVLTDRLALGLISNGASDTQRKKLTVMGVSEAFTATVLSGEVGVAKPPMQRRTWRSRRSRTCYPFWTAKTASAC